MTSSVPGSADQQEIRKRDYKHLLAKYKNAEEANDFFKLQLQDLNARLKIEHKDKERLRQELNKARSEICKKPNGHTMVDVDVEEVNSRLRDAYKKLEEEFELREQLAKDLDYTKTMLLAEGRTRMLLETRNSVLEQELKNLGTGKPGTDQLHIQLEELKKQLESEMKTRLALQEAKEELEGELEDLTKSLFEEANTMVSKEAKEKYELLQTKKRLEQELELAKSKIQLDEKILTSMKNKFTSLELKAKKLHRRTGSSSALMSTSPNPSAYLTSAQLRSASSHPNLLTLKDDVELRQRSKSLLLLGPDGQPQSVSLPSSPVSHISSHSLSPYPSPMTSPQNHLLSTPSSVNTTTIQIQLPLSPGPTPARPHPDPNDPNPITPSGSPTTSPAKPIPIHLSEPNLLLTSTTTTTQPIPIHNSDTYLNPSNLSRLNPSNLSHTSHPFSVSPIPSDLLATATNSSDDTISEISLQDTGSIVGEGDEWDVEWLLEEGEGERKEDDTVLFTEVEGHIDLQGGLSQFVQFLSTAKQDWTGRYMDRMLRDDIGPCLRLHTQEDRAYRKLLEAVWHNRIFVEPLAATLNEVCAGCGVEVTCRWRVRMGTSEHKTMGDMCRERIVRTCDFYVYLRNLRQGLIKKTLPNIYKEFLRLRLLMNFARICAG